MLELCPLFEECEIYMKNMLKGIFSNTKRLVWFFLLAGLFIVFYTPHLRFNIKLDQVTDGTVVVGNFNTDRGEEIFTNYNYNSHKTWYDVHPGWEEVNITTIPIVTNSLRVELDNVQTLVADKITVSFGPFTLKEYNASNITQEITSMSGLDLTLENNKINLHTQAVKGYFQLAQDGNGYLPRWAWTVIYSIIAVLCWIIADFITKHLDFLEHIPQNEVLLIAIPCLMFFVCECVLGNFYYIDLGHRLLNVGILIVIYKLVWLLFRRMPGSVLLVNLVLTIFSIVSIFVVQFRSRPIAPWDFSALGTAMNVAVNYDWTFPYFIFISLAAAIVLWLVMRMVPREKTKINRYYLAYPIIIVIVAVFFNSIGSYYLWDMNLLSVYQTDGTLLTFTGLFRQYMEEQPEAPDNYSIERLNTIGEKMQKDAQETTGNGIVPTNIIMIMNESFSDLNIGGTNYAGEVTPYFNHLDNTIRGNLYVSVRGGGTCNTEYETLSGNTTAFFSTGVYPYNMYMSRKVPSLVSYFNELGYHTTGIHLGKSTNWNRASAYQKLEFENTEFAETFDGLDTVHGYPTDQQDFEKVIEQYEAHKGEKQFIFNVTYQNHGGFDNADDLTKTVSLQGLGDGDYTHAENYLSLLKLTDEAYKNLIEYFSKVEEPTMIIMYGDHQPSLGADCDNLFFPHAGDSNEAFMAEHITPFSIWANYDLPDQTIDKMSTNYMSTLVLKTANLQMTPYQQYLNELREEYPVIGPYGCFDKNGRFYDSVNDIQDDLITDYRSLQYNNVFDEDRQTSLFYPTEANDTYSSK
jgi:phosphoglycerol transferase MdoB-like AlkP superfamily enzyme